MTPSPTLALIAARPGPLQDSLVAEGQTNAEIAEALVIGVGTVRTHVSNILAKLHLANRTQAALYALREGLTHLD